MVRTPIVSAFTIPPSRAICKPLAGAGTGRYNEPVFGVIEAGWLVNEVRLQRFTRAEE
jgi:hypothetical protein